MTGNFRSTARAAHPLYFELRNYGTTELRNYGTTELRNYGTTEQRNNGTTEQRSANACAKSAPDRVMRVPRATD
ncbi:hypothetical protein DID96_25835 [Burkholderia sp. Bp8963]|nr:hypothetical protein DID96_25835 [Burkholderia sp. Bp8963]